MKKILLLIFAVLLAGAMMQASLAEAYKGMDGAHDEESGAFGKHNLKVTKGDIHSVMRKYIEVKAAENNGVFELGDSGAGKVRRLSFIDLHEKLGMTGMQHYSCADFKDLDSGEILDIDIYVNMAEEGLKVADIAIHKVDGDPQFIYGKQGRMPADHANMKDMMKSMTEEEHKEGGSEK